MRFSIVVPVYNAEKYIDRCVNSIINQTHKEIEIILVNDGSKDRSGEICDEYAQKDTRIKVIHKPNGGVSSARNSGLKKAIGDYIIFVDSDDWIEKDMIARLDKILIEDKELDCIIYNLKNIEKSDIREDELLNNIAYLIKTEKINPPWNKVYKREILNKNNIKFDKKVQIGEDLLFNIQYLKNTKKIYLLNDILYNYVTENGQSLTKKYKKDKYEQLTHVNNRIREEMSKELKNKQLLDAVDYIRFKNICSCIMDLFHPNCPYRVREKYKYIKKVKSENKKLIIKRIDKKILLLSYIYSFLPSGILLIVFKILAKSRKG